MAGDDRIAGVAALFPAVTIVETQAALLLFRVVALVAFAREHGADLLFEKLGLLRRQCGRGEGGASGECENERRAGEGHRQLSNEADAPENGRRAIYGALASSPASAARNACRTRGCLRTFRLPS